MSDFTRAAEPFYDASGAPQLFFDMKGGSAVRTYENHPVYEVTSAQLPALQGLALAELHLKRDAVPRPHWHPNAGELIYTMSGELKAAVLDPATSALHTYRIKPGQVLFLPMGWWHWISCASEEARLLLLYNHSAPVTADSSAVLRHTPNELLHEVLGERAAQQYQASTSADKVRVAADLSKQQPKAEAPPSSVHSRGRSDHYDNAAASVSSDSSSSAGLSSAADLPAAAFAASSASGFPPKRHPAPVKKASSIRNSFGSGQSAVSPVLPEPAVWHPAIPGLQVRIGSTIHNS